MGRKANLRQASSSSTVTMPWPAASERLVPGDSRRTIQRPIAHFPQPDHLPLYHDDRRLYVTTLLLFRPLADFSSLQTALI